MTPTENDTTGAAVTAPAAPAPAATIADQVAPYADEIGDDAELVQGEYDRGRLLAFADRLFKRLAADEAEIDALTAAVRAEVQLLTERYQRVIVGVQKRVTWKRSTLEAIAADLFPDAAAKTKTVHLPYGSLSRKDYKPAPVLADEAAALAVCRTAHGDLVDVTISELRSNIRQWLINLTTNARTTETPAPELVDTFLYDLATGDELAGVSPALTDKLLWGAAKKRVAQGTAIPGITMAPARTEFVATLTEG